MLSSDFGNNRREIGKKMKEDEEDASERQNGRGLQIGRILF